MAPIKAASETGYSDCIHGCYELASLRDEDTGIGLLPPPREGTPGDEPRRGPAEPGAFEAPSLRRRSASPCPLPISTACEEIKRCAGTQFDPSVVEVFLPFPDSQWLELRENVGARFRLSHLKEL